MQAATLYGFPEKVPLAVGWRKGRKPAWKSEISPESFTVQAKDDLACLRGCWRWRCRGWEVSALGGKDKTDVDWICGRSCQDDI